MAIMQEQTPGITDYAALYSRPQLGAPSPWDEDPREVYRRSALDEPTAAGSASQIKTGAGPGIGNVTQLAGKLAPATKLGGLSKVLASKGGILGKIGKMGGKNPTPFALGGTAAGILGDLIAKKHAKTGGFVGGAGKGAALGATIGSVVPVLGTGVGAVLGGLVGGLKGLFGGKKKNKEKKAAEEAAKLAAAQKQQQGQGGFPLMPGMGVSDTWQGQMGEGANWARMLAQTGSQLPMWQPSRYAYESSPYQSVLGGPTGKDFGTPYNTGSNMTSNGSFGG